jgi:sugar O-acyltransferase (sialic acid O-acetyltransferase NeuD family)
MTPDVLIIGAGGHGRVVLDILHAVGTYNPIGFVDADPALSGTTIGGLPVLGPTNLLPKLRKQVQGGIVAIGDNRMRLRYAALMAEHQIPLINAIHPTAAVSASASIGRNIVLCAGAIVGTEAILADSVIVNSNAVVEHECVIGPGAHIAPGALLAGRVRIGDAAFIGLGAKIIQCLSIGDGAVIGAGAVVLRDVPTQATAIGIPAQVIKTAGM